MCAFAPSRAIVSEGVGMNVLATNEVKMYACQVRSLIGQVDTHAAAPGKRACQTYRTKKAPMGPEFFMLDACCLICSRESPPQNLLLHPWNIFFKGIKCQRQQANGPRPPGSPGRHTCTHMRTRGLGGNHVCFSLGRGVFRKSGHPSCMQVGCQPTRTVSTTTPPPGVLRHTRQKAARLSRPLNRQPSRTVLQISCQGPSG
jgi:hypothetical protein